MTAPAATACELRRQGELEVLAWPRLDRLGAEVLVTTTRGGVSSGPYASLNLSFSVSDEPAAVLANRHRVAAAIGADLADFVFARQVHGTRARVVGARDRGRGSRSLDDAIAETDALVTSDPGTVLAILVGDCVPVALLDPVARVLACVHAGWRGTVGRATAAALDAMATLGAEPQRVLAGIGPAIAPDRYQVGDEVAEQVRRAFDGDAADLLRRDGHGKWLLDLWEANRRGLIEAGVPDRQIQVAAIPTGPIPTGPIPTGLIPTGLIPTGPDPAGADPTEPDPGLFFSDRTARPCGRFALVARLTPSTAGPHSTPGPHRESA